MTNVSEWEFSRFSGEDRIREIVRTLHATDKKAHIPDEVRRYIRALRRIGVSYHEIERRFDVSRPTIARICRETERPKVTGDSPR